MGREKYPAFENLHWIKTYFALDFFHVHFIYLFCFLAMFTHNPHFKENLNTTRKMERSHDKHFRT